MDMLLLSSVITHSVRAMLIKIFSYIANTKNNLSAQTMGRRTALFLFVYHNLESKFSGLVCVYREVYACVLIDTLVRLSPFFFMR
jgi:hypothetical protein